jgi:hypothetical protein
LYPSLPLLVWAAATQNLVPNDYYIGHERVVVAVAKRAVDQEEGCIEDLVLLTRRNLDWMVLLGWVVFHLHRALASSLLGDLHDGFPLGCSLCLLSGISCKAKSNG